jgi:fatty acid amide hydrolase 2
MPDGGLLQISALQLARRIAARELSPLEAVDAHIHRIEEVNPRINAVVADRFSAARAEARAQARHGAGGADRPLLGVPFTVKEMIAVEGMPHTFGCRTRRGRMAVADATAVARLRRAGGIVLGVTNVPEWGMWFESFNDIYGRTSNPYDTCRTCGGSSGGEGAIVGAGGAVFGLGTDIGGSVRMPAAFCGVYGHKPSHGLVPLTGTFPVYANRGSGALMSAPWLTLGPLARSARDLDLLVRMMAGADGVDPNSRDVHLGSAGAVEWSGRRVLLLPAPRIRLARRTSPALRRAVQAAGRTLERLGASVDEAPDGLLHAAGDAWFAGLQSVGGPRFGELLGDGRRVHLLTEVAAAVLGRPRYSWPALYFLAGEVLGRKGARSLRRGLQERQRIADRMQTLIGDDGVLIAPVHPTVAPRHDTAVLHPFDFLYTAAFNALRMPATVAPAGCDDDGLPLAVQIAAADGRDHLTLAAAMALEDERGPWLPASLPPRRAVGDAGTRDGAGGAGLYHDAERDAAS